MKKLLILVLFLTSSIASAVTIVGNSRHVYDNGANKVTTAAFLTLFSSTIDSVLSVQVFDSSGQTMLLAWAPLCSGLSSALANHNAEYIAPGGWPVAILIPAGVCVGLKAVSGDAISGEFTANFLK